MTVSALLPTLAIAASISVFDFLRRLRQYRTISLLEISTRFRALFAGEVVGMTGGPFESPDKHRIVILFPQTDEGTREVPLWLSRLAARQNSGASNDTGELAMNWDRVEGDWKQFKGRVKEKWGNLTDDDLEKAAGNRDQLEGIIQKRYGIAKDQAKKDLNTWLDSM
jgi:uncharacterized protein YjbJ (UPF0337 family)